MSKEKTDIVALFKENDLLKICAPMVRYSKLQFRTLVRKHNVDLCFTPMILADSFCRSEKARNNEFTTERGDGPLIVQFAAKTVYDFVGASEMVYPYADGVDLNCGCPQRWAVQEGYGCGLISQPEKAKELISAVKNRLPQPFSVSVKIRLQPNIEETVELCRQLEHCGATFLTAHGRTQTQKSEPVDSDTLTEIKKSIKIPLVANGDIRTINDAIKMKNITNCDGVMAARGILTNPALFGGAELTNANVIQEWLNICESAGSNISFQCFHHHLVFMLEKILPKRYRNKFNNLTTKDHVLEFIKDMFNITPSMEMPSTSERIQCCYNDDNYKKMRIDHGIIENLCKKCDLDKESCVCEKSVYDINNSGTFYRLTLLKNLNEKCDLDFMDSTIFNVI